MFTCVWLILSSAWAGNRLSDLATLHIAGTRWGGAKRKQREEGTRKTTEMLFVNNLVNMLQNDEHYICTHVYLELVFTLILDPG